MKTLNRFSIAACTSLSLLLAGCGSDQFRTANYNERQTAPGTFTIPAKVDIVMAVDDTGSMGDIWGSIRGQIPAFLGALESSGWDYRFAAIPLTKDKQISQIVASRYDGNWLQYGGWLAPYPGANPNTAGMFVNPRELFKMPSQYSEYIQNFYNGGMHEPGLDTIVRNLKSGFTRTSLLRNDAMLVVVPITNGEDTSRIADYGVCNSYNPTNYQYNEPGCVQARQASFNALLNDFRTVKATPALLRMYSAASFRQYGSAQGAFCDGSQLAGTRYIDMANALGGKGINICSSSASSLLSTLSSELQSTRLNLKTRYLVIDKKPNLATVQITAQRTSGSTLIPQDPNNGWTYIDSLGPITVNTVELDTPNGPIGLTQATGYVFELRGSAVLIGDETADVKYDPAK